MQAAKTSYHHGDLAAALVVEATRVTRAEGADAVSLRKVAQAVGVSPSAAYAHFADKEQLLIQVAAASEAMLDQALLAAAQSAPGDSDAAAVQRFVRVGAAYIGFARDEAHLFRHAFGPYCVHSHEYPAQDVDLDRFQEESLAFSLLRIGLADLDQRGLLQPGVRDGLEITLWTMVHGFASLMIDGCLSSDWEPQLLDSAARLVLTPAARQLEDLANPSISDLV